MLAARSPNLLMVSIMIYVKTKIPSGFAYTFVIEINIFGYEIVNIGKIFDS